MRLIADELGYFELHEVKRFAEPWEGPASLRIRAGDATAVREYIERGRVLEGTEDEVTARLVKQYTGQPGRRPESPADHRREQRCGASGGARPGPAHRASARSTATGRPRR